MIIILGKVAAAVHLTQPQDQVTYLQKLFFVTAVSIFIQVLWGHKLPVISGPATILLLGVLSSQSSGADVVYTSMMVGGLLLAILTLSGLFGALRKLFTHRIVAVVLLLIAVTLAPTIVRLIVSDEGGVSPLANILFALALLAFMFLLHRLLSGIWKSALIVWTISLWAWSPSGCLRRSLLSLARYRGCGCEICCSTTWRVRVAFSSKGWWDPSSITEEKPESMQDLASSKLSP